MVQLLKLLRTDRAQTALELAIFGSILIFMIGIIVRQALSSGNQQNQALKAARMAMSLSYKHSEGIEGTCQILGGDQCNHGDTSRNGASVTIVEDRLTANSGKYGTIDRVPFMTGASATNSRNLFMPVEVGEYWNYPVMDYFINGQHFPFTIARLEVISLEQFLPDGVTPNPKVKNWDPNCVTLNDQPYGCAELWTRIPNHPKIAEWCPTDPCPVVSANERFDLDHDGTTDVPPSERATFAWQWNKIKAFDVNQGNAGTLNSGQGVNFQKNSNVNIDVDSDNREERIMGIQAVDPVGVIKQILVLDFQDGDIDSTFNKDEACLNNPSTCTVPGLQRDLQMYTQLKNGTYLQIEEGKLYGPGKQFVRTSSKKDQADLIERVFVLSNNTERFCKNGQPTPNGDGSNGYEWQPPSYPNPVEACNDCFSQENIKKTCMLVDDSTKTYIIYIRSIINDKSGRRWVTDDSSDKYINYEKTTP